ncbi:hypothetical protein Paes_0975 [Prosthecochloris aestuarii DSM 271]|uniref:Uncharacterized protein n=1 Tax=Prosthecochloris aestuarii (strain DSM 271 / SK 413) TaxID=290512 RepID=B4S7H9_PROA2|nr:hypothetical protein [Prosthecochloris aestuarii]ACF46016.1 hypothetical protein Paes_0975 [Prosthecochloris aestuarii DSM 271]
MRGKGFSDERKAGLAEIYRNRHIVHDLKKGAFYSGEGSFMNLDTLEIVIDDDELAEYAKSVSADHARQKRICKQIRAHESYHVYQSLASSSIDEYALSERRIKWQKINVLSELVRAGKYEDLSGRNAEIPVILEDYDKESLRMVHAIVNDNRRWVEKIYVEGRGDSVSVCDIIEGSAVCFQHLFDHDVEGAVVHYEEPVYLRAWNLYYDKTDVSLHDAKIVFLFMCDIYLKCFDFRNGVVDEVEVYMRRSKPHIAKMEHYRQQYDEKVEIDFSFSEALKKVKLNERQTKRIIEYVKRIPDESRRKLYVYVMVYSEMFRDLVLVGMKDDSMYSNKYAVANRIFSKSKEYWGSELVLPCVLSDEHEMLDFSRMLQEMMQEQYIDDITHSKMQDGKEENMMMNFVRRIEPVLNGEFRHIYCCKKHGYTNIRHVVSCGEPDSLSSLFENFFGKSLSVVSCLEQI